MLEVGVRSEGLHGSNVVSWSSGPVLDVSPADGSMRPCWVLVHDHVAATPGRDDRIQDAPAFLGRVAANGQEGVRVENAGEHLPVRGKPAGAQICRESDSVQFERIVWAVDVHLP